MALCHVTGIVYLPDGTVAARREVAFYKLPDNVTADYLGAVVPEPVVTRTDNDGAIDVNLITGNYHGYTLDRNGRNRYQFKAAVPESASADFSDLIAAVDPIEPLPAWLQQAIEARDRAEDAAQVAEDVVGGLGTLQAFVDEAEGWAGVAESFANDAELSASNAANGASAAEAARDAATVNAQVYADTVAGLAATTVGDQFQVVNGDEIIRYRHDAGPVATEVARYPSAGAIAPLKKSGPDGYAFAIEDGAGRIAVGVKDDGTLAAASAAIGELDTAGLSIVPSVGIPGPALSITDAHGNAAIVVNRDGTVDHVGAEASPLQRAGGRFTAQVVFFNNTGQSLSVGPTPAITTTARQDNVTLNSYSLPSQVVPAVATTAEPPMFGAMEMIKYLIAQENGVTWEANDYQLCAVGFGSGGAYLSAIEKNGVENGAYARMIKCLTFVNDEYVNRGGRLKKTVGFGATFFTQGESDQNYTPEAEYTTRIIKYANDADTDGRAITGQLNRVPFICYQTHAHEQVNGPRIGIALLEAHKRSPLVHMATPIYFLNFWDGSLHLDSASSKILGAYYGLVYKRVVIDGLPWEPLRPVAHTVVGNSITLFFTKDGLVFDVDGLNPEQPNYGFTVRNASGALVTISSVEIVGSNSVRVTTTSAPQSGWTVRYGDINTVNRPGYTVGSGNLRDSAGDALVFADEENEIEHPMHNWCVFFRYEI